VRSLIAGILRDLGHTVWEANNPGVALQILEREQPIDLLLVDYAMPEMNGLAVIDRATLSRLLLNVSRILAVCLSEIRSCNVAALLAC